MTTTVKEAIKDGNVDMLSSCRFTREDIVADDNHALVYAATNGYVDLLRYMVESFDLTADDAHSQGDCALIGASAMGKMDCVRYLVDTFQFGKHDNINEAMCQAAGQEQLEPVRFFVEHFQLTKHDVRPQVNRMFRYAIRGGPKGKAISRYLHDTLHVQLDEFPEWD